MKTIEAYEFKDLDKQCRERVREKMINDEVEFQIQGLDKQFNDDLITEKDFYRVLGCSKEYAESTAWFVPSCYYQKNKKEVDEQVDKTLKEALFNSWGVVIA